MRFGAGRRPEREDEGESAALVHDGFHGQAGFHLLGQFIDHREAQPGAAAGGEGFGGEERFEDARQDFPARCRIRNPARRRLRNAPPRAGASTRSAGNLSSSRVARMICFCSAGHGFRGVEDEVQEDLLDEILGAADLREARRAFEGDLHLAQEPVAEQLDGVVHDGIEVARAGLLGRSRG